MKLKELEMLLQRIDGFDAPKVQFEQYETGDHIAARVVHTIHTTDDMRGKAVADLGCGCGKLAIGCALLGANYVFGVDVDSDAIDRCRQNCLQMDEQSMPVMPNIDLLCGDVCDHSSWQRFSKCFDVVVMNPPFGTKTNKGIDMTFLKRGLQMATKSVYSLHKSSTRQHILKKANEWRVKAEIVAQLRFDIPAVYKFHKQSTLDIEVDFYRFAHTSRSQLI